MSGDHNQYQRDEENVSYMYTLPENGALRISVPLPDPQITWGHSNTSEIWARVDKDGNVTHLDMELCAKGPHNAYTALAMAIWNKAIETEREKVAAWMMARGYATGHGDSTEALLNELEWQIAENLNRAITTEREACANVCDVLAVHPEYASDITKVAAQAIRARGEK
jgi:hypothetical protein